MKRLLIVGISFLLALAATVYGMNRTRRRHYPIKPTTRQKIAALENAVAGLVLRVDALEKKIKIIDEKVDPTVILKKQGKVQRIALPLQIGQVVYFAKDDKLRIEQIMDISNMRVELSFGEWVGNVWVPLKRVVWMRGLNTSKYVDGMVLKPDARTVFKITETIRYTTAIGSSRTVFVLDWTEPGDIQ